PAPPRADCCPASAANFASVPTRPCRPLHTPARGGRSTQPTHRRNSAAGPGPARSTPVGFRQLRVVRPFPRADSPAVTSRHRSYCSQAARFSSDCVTISRPLTKAVLSFYTRCRPHKVSLSGGPAARPAASSSRSPLVRRIRFVQVLETVGAFHVG